jgi:hypothetical protein
MMSFFPLLFDMIPLPLGAIAFKSRALYASELSFVIIDELMCYRFQNPNVLSLSNQDKSAAERLVWRFRGLDEVFVGSYV